jgi:hypothetical protein
MIKWIGQHIFDLITRFRSDIYIDNISEEAQTHVIGIDTDGKLTKFDTPSGGNGSGDENLDEAFTVSNKGAGFSHVLNAEYTTLTSYTTVLKALLNPYNLSTINLSSVKLWKADVNGSYTSGDPYSYATVEVGQKWKIDEVSYYIGTAGQLQANSVKFRVKTPGASSYTDLQTGLASSTQTNFTIDITGTPTYYEVTDTTVSNVSSGDRYQFDVSAIDEDGGSNVTIEDSSDMVVTVKDRVKFGAYAASTTTTIANNTEATTLFTDLVTAVDDLSNKSNDTATQIFNASAGMANASNYTWIVYPQSWGALARIDLQPGTNVLGAFESSTHTVTNSYGQAIGYYFYRSRITGPFVQTQDQLQLIF